MSHPVLKNALSIAVVFAVFGLASAGADTTVSVDGDQIKQVVQEQEQLRNTERKQLRTQTMTDEGYSSSAEKIRAREQKREQQRIHTQTRTYSGDAAGLGQRGSSGAMGGAGGGKGGRR
jgi:hypothetical protein